MRAPHRLWALVLAGGDGTRLQSLTRPIAGAPIPKQYCRILGDRSLLQATLDRIAPVVPRDRTLVVVNRAHLALARPQLEGLLPGSVLVQPRNLDTGPGLVLSLLALARRDPRATVAVFPSDHDVRDSARFRRHVARMERLVDRHPDGIALLGVRPDRPDDGYGYIAPSRAVAGFADAFHVLAFHEKPTARLAARIIGRGGLWNAFVMVGRVARLLALLRDVRPHDVAALEGLAGEPAGLAAAYDRMPPWNFSRDFLARVTPHLLVARADGLGWSDWGTPEAIERSLAAIGIVPPCALRATA